MSKKPLLITVVAAESSYTIHAKDKPLQTPMGHAYAFPSAALAEVVAEEWRNAPAKINPRAMPFTQLASTALDIIAPVREKILDTLASFVATELLCHRAEAPPDLVVRQKEIWQPYLDACAASYGVVFNVGTGILPVRQNQETAPALRKVASTFDNFALAGLRHAADLTGSLVLALALAQGQGRATDIFEAAELETLFQQKNWGSDPATEANLNAIKQDLEICERWLALTKTAP